MMSSREVSCVWCVDRCAAVSASWATQVDGEQKLPTTVRTLDGRIYGFTENVPLTSLNCGVLLCERDRTDTLTWDTCWRERLERSAHLQVVWRDITYLQHYEVTQKSSRIELDIWHAEHKVCIHAYWMNIATNVVHLSVYGMARFASESSETLFY